MDYAYGITLEERQLQIKHNIKKLGIPLKELNKKELEAEVAKFLKKKQCLALATIDRKSVV